MDVSHGIVKKAGLHRAVRFDNSRHPGRVAAWGSESAHAEGGLAGWLTGKIMGGPGKGVVLDIVVGLVGALAGGSVGLYLDKQAKELEQVAETKRTENGVLVNMKNDILFDTGSAILKDPAVEQVSKVGDILAKYSDDRVKIEGHTDSVGDAKHNQTLSEKRAHAVKTVLVSRGVQEKQILVLGLGESRPIADNKTTDGRAKNRRVELVKQ